MDDMKLTHEEEMQKLKDTITSHEELAVTYQFISRGKWKTRTDIIKSEKLPYYEATCRVLYITTVETHNKLMADLKRRKK